MKTHDLIKTQGVISNLRTLLRIFSLFVFLAAALPLASCQSAID